MSHSLGKVWTGEERVEAFDVATLKLAGVPFVPYVFRDLTPVNAVAAKSTLAFSGVVSDGETVVIGDDTYEFDTDSDVAEGNIAVDVSGGATASAAVIALVAASAGGTEPVTLTDGTGDTVVVTADVKGTAAEAILTSTDCENGAFDVAHLDGGVDGTVGVKGESYCDGTNIYVATAANTVADANWKKVELSVL